MFLRWGYSGHHLANVFEGLLDIIWQMCLRVCWMSSSKCVLRNSALPWLWMPCFPQNDKHLPSSTHCASVYVWEIHHASMFGDWPGNEATMSSAHTRTAAHALHDVQPYQPLQWVDCWFTQSVTSQGQVDIVYQGTFPWMVAELSGPGTSFMPRSQAVRSLLSSPGEDLLQNTHITQIFM